LDIIESSVKKHVQEIFEETAVEIRGAAVVRSWNRFKSLPR